MVSTRSSSNVTASLWETKRSQRNVATPAAPVKVSVVVPGWRDLSASRQSRSKQQQQRPPTRAAALEATKRMSAMAADSYDFDE